VDKVEMKPHLHTYLLLSPVMCYDLDQTAYYHMHHLLVWRFMSGPALGWSQTKKFYIYIHIYIYKNKESVLYICIQNSVSHPNQGSGVIQDMYM